MNICAIKGFIQKKKKFRMKPGNFYSKIHKRVIMVHKAFYMIYPNQKLMYKLVEKKNYSNMDKKKKSKIKITRKTKSSSEQYVGILPRKPRMQ